MDIIHRCARLLAVIALLAHLPLPAQTVHYSGTVLSDPWRHDGGLPPVAGVECIQVHRAMRTQRQTSGTDGEHAVANRYTYNHQPMLTCWQGRLWLHYLSDSISEHVPPSVTWMQSSSDGRTWTQPRVLFPSIGDTVVMHQRIGWHVTSPATGRRLLALGFYGICARPGQSPNDGNGMGRVVREIKADGSMGEVFFLVYNHGYSEENTPFRHYSRSRDRQLRHACDELLADPTFWMQCVEECDRGDSRLPLKAVHKAFCWYPLPGDSVIVGLWKHALTATSHDSGHTWGEPVARAPGFVNSNAKIWGQRLTDGTYATVYNPSEWRWPLAISTSADGVDYTTLSLVCGEVPPMRYGGRYKSQGPQYVRGILPDGDQPADSALWVAFSMNKEDIWVARIPVPIVLDGTGWSTYAPLLCPVAASDSVLTLHDSAPFDYARAERIIDPSVSVSAAFDVEAMQNSHGRLEIELLAPNGTACTRLVLASDSTISIKVGPRSKTLVTGYAPQRRYHVDITAEPALRRIGVSIDGSKPKFFVPMAPVASIGRIAFRTGERRYHPTPDTPPDRMTDLPDADSIAPEAAFIIRDLHITPLGNDQAMLDSLFNLGVPSFECPDERVNRIYRYRWEVIGKHLKMTPVGWAMTEFLVPRSYADRWNLISCALGHHIMETRWLRDTTYCNQIVHTWLRGRHDTLPDGRINEGPLKKLDFYSQWLAHAMLERTRVAGDTAWLLAYRSDMAADVARWDSMRLGDDGLYWQYDVRDGMEESISGGRKQRNRRPSINSYMWANLSALAEAAHMAGDDNEARRWREQADTLRQHIVTRLWNPQHQFFETLTEGDTLAQVREAIGFLPWYVNMPFKASSDRDGESSIPGRKNLAAAWHQLADPQGFSAPFGITTAERRHPLFRSHGTGRCEWDGAVWPFATSQTLTAYANYLEDMANRREKDDEMQGNTLRNTGEEGVDTLWFHHFITYTASQFRRGEPYIGEYLDETTGAWLMGDRLRSRDYNHSTYADLIITGLVGLRPAMGDNLTVRPLLPPSAWPWFRLSGVRYHGHDLTILWDRRGDHYHQGKGLRVYVDRRLCASRPDLGPLHLTLP